MSTLSNKGQVSVAEHAPLDKKPSVRARCVTFCRSFSSWRFSKQQTRGYALRLAPATFRRATALFLPSQAFVSLSWFFTAAASGASFSIR